MTSSTELMFFVNIMVDNNIIDNYGLFSMDWICDRVPHEGEHVLEIGILVDENAHLYENGIAAAKYDFGFKTFG